jgi:KaiC/GvpD/RAD55 family RecA-like ATPase
MTQTIPQPGGLRTSLLGELLAKKIEPREPLLSPWLRTSDSALIYAPAGAGKSIFTLAVALAIAGGGSLLGWTAPKPRKVLLIDGEMPEEDIIGRARMLLPSIEGCDSAAADRNLCALIQQAQDMDAPFPDIGTPDGQNLVMQMAREGAFDVVIFDNFSTLTECADENSAASFNGILKFLKRLKQGGIACILIHHTGKNNGTFRGSSKLAATFEVLISLKASARAAPPGALGIDLEWEKYRRRRDASIRNQTIWLTDTEADTPPVWGSEETGDEDLAQTVTEARTCKHRTQADLARALGKTPGAVTKRRKRAIAAGLITSEEWDACFSTAGGEESEAQAQTEEEGT